MASQMSRSPKEEEDPKTQFYGRMSERIVLQRLIVIARLPHDLADRTEPGAHYEKLHFQLSKQYILDPLTGLLLVYSSCLLHIIESSRDVLISVLKDMQQQPAGVFMEAPKVVFMAHDLRRRLFPQWSYKVLDADQSAGDFKGVAEEEESIESLVCSVLSTLQTLGERLKASGTAGPGSVLDEAPELIVSQKLLNKLLTRGELQTPQQYLQMYNSPLNICMNAGRVVRSSCLTTV